MHAEASSALLPAIVPGAQFAPPEEIDGRPHAVVDGPRLPGTALALSHWPDSGTPEQLARDTSALIVDAYLRACDDGHAGGQALERVTNNHFDEDGLLALWLLLERPAEGSPERRLALEAAEAGDFRTWRDPWAARIALAAMAMAERGTTPFASVTEALRPEATRDPAGAIYRALLPRAGRLLTDPERWRRLWGPPWQRVEADLALLDAGEATIEERAGADLALVRAARPLTRMALYPRLRAMRVLSAAPDGTLVLEHRYETWVRYVSRPLAPRVDLRPLLPRLQAGESRPGRWRFDGVEAIQPRLFLAGRDGRPAPSGIGAERLAEEIVSLSARERAA